MRKRLPTGSYDTSKAHRVCAWTLESAGGEVFERLTLYRTIRGKFFIHALGSQGTPHADREPLADGKMYTRGAGEDIYPVSLEEARDLANKYATIEEAAAFSDKNERRSSITMSSTAWEDLTKQARRAGLTRDDYLEKLVGYAASNHIAL